jgi:hypothetical protein
MFRGIHSALLEGTFGSIAFINVHKKKKFSKRSRYVVSYIKFLEDFAQTNYCSSNEKKKKNINFCRV